MKKDPNKIYTKKASLTDEFSVQEYEKPIDFNPDKKRSSLCDGNVLSKTDRAELLMRANKVHENKAMDQDDLNQEQMSDVSEEDIQKFGDVALKLPPKQKEEDQTEEISYNQMGVDPQPIEETDTEIIMTIARLNEIKGLDAIGSILKTLCLRQNFIKQITGLDACVNLTELDLYDNRIKEIGGLSHNINLQHLDLSQNIIRKIENLDGLTNIKKLFLCSNKIKVMENLSHISRLTMLELGANRISEIGDLSFCRENLEELQLGRNRLTSLEGLQSADFNCLNVLSVPCNRLSSVDHQLDKLLGLSELHISENDISNLKGQENCASLSLLDLSYNKISLIDDSLKNNELLKELWLTHNKIENFSDLDGLKQNVNLNTIQLFGNPVNSFPSIREEITKLIPHIKQIDANVLNQTINIVNKRRSMEGLNLLQDIAPVRSALKKDIRDNDEQTLQEPIDKKDTSNNKL